MKYDLKIHLPQVVEEIRQEYRSWLGNGNPIMFLNGVEDVKEILRNGKEHSEFLTLLTKDEKDYDNTIKGLKENLVKTIRNASTNDNLDKAVENIGQAVRSFDEGLQGEQARYLEQLKINVLGYMPHIEMGYETS